MIRRLLVASLAGATLAMPAALIATWVLATLPADRFPQVFLDFEMHRIATLLGWVLASWLCLAPAEQPAASWRRMQAGLAIILLCVPLWTLVAQTNRLAVEIAEGGPTPVLGMALTGAVCGLLAGWGWLRLRISGRNTTDKGRKAERQGNRA